MKKRKMLCALIVLLYTCFSAFTAIAETPCAHSSRKVELVSAATCTTGSVEREVCTLCGAQLDTWTNNDELGHSWKTETVSAATCTADSVEREVCSRCGEVNDLWTNNDKLGHSWKTETVSAATCTADSVEREVCSRCGEVNDQWTNSDKLGHSWKTETVSVATCTKGSVEREVCSRCAVENRRWTNSDAKGHMPGTAATCTNPQLCTVCKTALAPAKGHTPGAAATCTNPQLCTVCKAALAPAKGHTPGAPAACDKAQLCEVCGMVLADALQHSYKSTIFAPTESKQGFTRYTCILCGNVYDGNFKRTLGKPEQGVDSLQLMDAQGRDVPYNTEEANEPLSAGAAKKKLLTVTAQTDNQGAHAGYYDFVLTKSAIDGVLADGYDGICMQIGDVEIVLPLENFNKNDILADVLKDQDVSDENMQYIIRLSQEEVEGITNALTPAYRVDMLLNANGNELDIGDILGGMVIRMHDGGADTAQTDVGLYYQPKLTGENSPAVFGQVTRIDDGWEAPLSGSGVYAVIDK